MKGPFPSRAEGGEIVLLMDQKLLFSHPGHGQHWPKDHSDGATGGSGAEAVDAQGGRKQKSCGAKEMCFEGTGERVKGMSWAGRCNASTSLLRKPLVPLSPCPGMPSGIQRALGLWERGRGQDPLLFVAAV